MRAALLAALALSCRFDVERLAATDDARAPDDAAASDDAATLAADGSPACLGYPAVLGNSRYRLEIAARSWYEAELACEADGGHLAIIETAEENQFVFGLYPAGNVWIGLGDHRDEGVFGWVNGLGLGYTDWQTGQPNDSGTEEDCVEINEPQGDWNDNGCRYPSVSVCECDGQRLPVPPTWCNTDLDSDCGECGMACTPPATCQTNQVCL